MTMTATTRRSLSLRVLLFLAALSAVQSFSNVARGQRSIRAFVVSGAKLPTTTLYESTQPEADAAAAPVEAAAPTEISVPAPAEAAVSVEAGTSTEVAAPSEPAAAAPAEAPAEFSETYVRCGKCQTIYALTEDDLGPNGRGRRLECSVCAHSWFQSKDRIMFIKDGFEYVKMADEDLTRISQNIEEGRKPSFLGETKLYVGNIAFECSEDDIQETFGEIGPVGEVSLVRDELGRIRGFGFITMRFKADGQKAIDALDGSEIKGRKIAVRESNN